MNDTRVTGPYKAVIDGKTTGLAGCSDADACERASFCLRADPALKYRAPHMHDGKCNAFISKAKEAA